MTDKTKPSDDQILEKARAIQAQTGASLVDAMLEAEEALRPKRQIPEGFTVEIKVKSRVARWILDEFGGHSTLSVEERLGVYLGQVLSRSRVQAIRLSEEGEDLQSGQAVTVRRERMAAKVAK